MPRAPFWSDDEVRQLMQLVGTAMPAEIAKAIGRTTHAVIDYCHRRHISLATKKVLKPWTDEELRQLRSLAGTMGQKEVAALLGRTRRSVSCKAMKHGISFPFTGMCNHRAKYSDEDVELCRQLFEVGVSRKDIAEKMEIPYQTVVDILLYRTRKTNSQRLQKKS